MFWDLKNALGSQNVLDEVVDAVDIIESVHAVLMVDIVDIVDICEAIWNNARS